MGEEQLILLCPGQGAQRVGMGRAWVDASDAARAVMDEADALLGDRLGRLLSEYCFDGPEDDLNRTDISQPAIYACSVACLAALREQGMEGPLTAVAGLSLGEYTALHVAGVFDFATGLELVATRGRLMQEAAEACESSMVAIMGDDEAAQGLCSEVPEGDEVLVAANFNAPGQVVLSGATAACHRAAEVAGDRGLRGTPLAVAGAFHSPYMQSAADGMRDALALLTLAPPTIDAWSNVTAALHEADSIAQRLVQQVTHPVRWAQQCAAMAAKYHGAWHELAPAGVLRGLMRRIDRDVKVTSHDTP